jgi:UV DNA damage endonuclease
MCISQLSKLHPCKLLSSPSLKGLRGARYSQSSGSASYLKASRSRSTFIEMPRRPKPRISLLDAITSDVHNNLLALADRSAISSPPRSRRGKVDTNPDHENGVIDSMEALRASPDADEKGEAFKLNGVIKTPEDEDSSALSDLEEPVIRPAKKPKKTPTKSSVAAKKGSDEIKAFKAEQAAKKAVEKKVKMEDEDDGGVRADPDGDEDGPAEDADALKREAARPPPVNSDYLPLPWKGRLGYVSLTRMETVSSV